MERSGRRSAGRLRPARSRPHRRRRRPPDRRAPLGPLPAREVGLGSRGDVRAGTGHPRSAPSRAASRAQRRHRRVPLGPSRSGGRAPRAAGSRGSRRGRGGRARGDARLALRPAARRAPVLAPRQGSGLRGANAAPRARVPLRPGPLARGPARSAVARRRGPLPLDFAHGRAQGESRPPVRERRDPPLPAHRRGARVSPPGIELGPPAGDGDGEQPGGPFSDRGPPARLLPESSRRPDRGAGAGVGRPRRRGQGVAGRRRPRLHADGRAAPLPLRQSGGGGPGDRSSPPRGDRKGAHRARARARRGDPARDPSAVAPGRRRPRARRGERPDAAGRRRLLRFLSPLRRAPGLPRGGRVGQRRPGGAPRLDGALGRPPPDRRGEDDLRSGGAHRPPPPPLRRDAQVPDPLLRPDRAGLRAFPVRLGRAQSGPDRAGRGRGHEARIDGRARRHAPGRLVAGGDRGSSHGEISCASTPTA